jgi:hypothetical protein
VTRGSIPLKVREDALKMAFPEANPYTHDPHAWVREKLRGHLWSKQVEIAESVRDNRYTAVPACHGPGKSYDASAIAAWWKDAHPPGESMIITTAPTDHQVKAILWREIKRRHAEGNLDGRITLEGKWYIGERLVDEELCGFGRKPQDYDADAFQGIHEKFVLVIIDEACGVNKDLFDALETLMTNDYARMLAIGNPDDPTSYFERICQPGSGWNVIRIPVWSTPNFTGEYVPQHIAERLVTKLWVEERKQKWGVGSPLWQSKVEAEFPEISNDTLITPKWVREASERDLPGVELGNYAFDIARFGSDETVGYRNRGGKVRRVYEKHQQDTHLTANAIHGFLIEDAPQYIPAVIDVVGLGAGVVDDLKHRDLNVIPFNSSNSPNDGERFRNRRAECYWRLREMFENGEIDIDPHDEELHAQLVSMKWYIDRWGRINIESKEDMKRRGLPSPDRADAVMMACASLSVMQEAPIIVTAGTVTGDLLGRAM